MARALRLVASAVLLMAVSTATLANAQCYTFYTGLCPGSASCQCTLAESCVDVKNYTEGYLRARTPSGGCGGYCMTVEHGACAGPDSCLAAIGSCGGPAPGPGPNPPPPPPPPPPGSGAVGGDVSAPVSSGTFSCTVSNGWQFVIVRSYKSYGAPDSNAPGTLSAAASAGIQYRDIYHFPCAGSDAGQQVRDDVNAVGQGNFGTLWFDIETNPSPGCGWSSDTSSNCQFLQSMIDAGNSLGIKMGVYSSTYMWSSIMGSGCTAGSSLPLWYAHYDGQKSFSDFQSFGGWYSPTMKQYWDSVGICGIGADADWVA